MAIVTQTINVDLRPHYNRRNQSMVYCSQYDNDLRNIVLNIANEGVPVDVSTYTIYIEGTKPDKHGFSYELTSIGGSVSNNVITVPLQTQMTAAAGLTNAEVVLYSNDERIGSANFILNVEKAGLAEDVDISETDIPAYVDGAQQAAAEATQAKDTAVSAAETAQDVLDSIPADYSDLSDTVDDLKNAFEQLPTSIQPDMSVGNVFSDDSYTEDKTPYLYRVSGGGVEVGKVEADEIVGGSVAWNQLSKTETSAYSPNVGTRSYDSSTNTFTVTNSATASWLGVYSTSSNIIATANHKYLLLVKATNTLTTNLMFGTETSYKIQSGFTADTEKECATVISPTTRNAFIFYFANASSVKFRDIQIFDLTQMFGSAVADYLYSLETATAGAGVAFFRSLFPNDYYEYNAGELMHVSGLSEHVMGGKNLNPNEGVNYTTNDSQRFFMKAGSYVFSTDNGAVIAGTNAVYIQLQNEDGTVITKGGITSTNMQLNGTELYYFGGQFNSECAFTLNYDAYMLIGFNNQKPTNFNALQIELGTRATAYKPYHEPYTYPLDSSLTLRGVPKLDSSNNLYYDGDVYSADGTVTRKYGIVDMGTLNWQLSSSTASGFYTGMHRYAAGTNVGMICAKYPFAGATTSNYYEEGLLKCFTGSSNPAREIYIKDSKYSDAATFKSAMSGVMLVYELDTPTEETAEPYEEYQHVTNGGTEEYVSTGIVPVGHITKYPTDIVAKVDGLPSDFSTLIAPTEKGFTATRAYSVNQFMIINNQLYKATASIANGATITVGTNVTATTIADILTSLLNA